jgi:hypothetical protein
MIDWGLFYLKRPLVSTVLMVLGYDHVVLLLALIKLDYNLTSTSWNSSSGLRGRRRTYRTILEWADHKGPHDHSPELADFGLEVSNQGGLYNKVRYRGRFCVSCGWVL